MKETVDFLARHGYWLLFASILGRQACLPIPANLLLLAAGALVGLGRLSFVGVIVFSVPAFILADFAWYEAGRRWGSRTLRFICGAARDPASCKSKIAARFNRHGVRLLLFSKFIIGLDAVAAPMAGISQIDRVEFLAYDALGAILWSCAYAAVGYAFSNQLDYVATYSSKLGMLAVLAGIAGLGVFIIVKLTRWYRFLREFRLGQITPDQLRSKLIAGDDIVIVDLQGSAKQNQLAIPGSVRIDPSQLRRYGREYREADLGMKREVILYCSSPSEYTSARVALTLRRRGFELVRPLAGGLGAWVSRGFPVTANLEMLPSPDQTAYVLREILQCSWKNTAELFHQSDRDVDELLEGALERIRTTEASRLLRLKQGDTDPDAEPPASRPIPTAPE